MSGYSDLREILWECQSGSPEHVVDFLYHWWKKNSWTMPVAVIFRVVDITLKTPYIRVEEVILKIVGIRIIGAICIQLQRQAVRAPLPSAKNAE